MDFVALETIRELQHLDTSNEYFILVSPGEDRCLEETANFHLVEIKCPTYPLWEQYALPKALKKIQPDIVHCTSNTAPVCCSFPLVLTLHDIIFLEKKQSRNTSLYQNLGRYYRRLIVPRILPRCQKIITVSRFECERIRETLHLPATQITTVYNGFSSHFHPQEHPEQVTRQYIDTDRYIFFLGNTDPKKNTPTTLKAYSLYVKQSAAPLPLLIADLKEKVIDTILKEEGIGFIKPYLRFPGYIPNTALPYLYSGAAVFLYTSLRESFGIPLLEAMACGTPVVTSNTSAIPEIAGKEAILTNPADASAIASQLIRLETQPAFRQQQIAYGLERAKLFSWRHTAQQLLELYKSLLSD